MNTKKHKPPIIISFSGPPGSGKTPSAIYVANKLAESGISVSYFKYRKFSLKTFFRPKEPIPVYEYEKDMWIDVVPTEVRWQNYRHKKTVQFLIAMPLYWVKVLLFFIYLQLRCRSEIVFLDRFVYDSFVHFDLSTKSNRLIFTLFLKFIPHPHLIFFMHGDPQHIHQNKARHCKLTYDLTYIEHSLKNYSILKDILSNLKKNAFLLDLNDITKKMEETALLVNKHLKENK